jgi:signal transduction histidine kinase
LGHTPAAHALLAGDVDAPLALCTSDGELYSAAPVARALLQELGMLDELPVRLPGPLWQALEDAQLGEAVVWQATPDGARKLECTRYCVQQGGFLLWLRELHGESSLSESLRRERQAAAGRLMASVAHDVRSSVASIVYSADFLDARCAAMKQETLQDTVRDICEASRRLQLTVDGLLDYARLGPAISVPVSLHEVLNRAQGLLRSFYRDGAHRLRLDLPHGADWVRGNPVIIEQIFVNVLLHSAELADAGSIVTVSAATSANDAGLVRIQICCEGARLAEPAQEGKLIAGSLAASALVDARAAAESQGGQLLLEQGPTLGCAVLLPRSEGPR